MTTHAERAAAALYAIDARPTDAHPYEVHVAYDVLENGSPFQVVAEYDYITPEDERYDQ